ncbi:MAG: hypothetical protein ABSB41_00125 [Anaerolineales bacterium]|jgi:hypothetical protein
MVKRRGEVLLSVVLIFSMLACNLLQGIRIGTGQTYHTGKSVSALIEAAKGGSLTLETDRGDQVTLELGPKALGEDTTITLTELTAPPANPIAANFFPGVLIQPDGLVLHRPGLLKVSLKQSTSSLGHDMLLSVKSPTLVVPLGKQSRSESGGPQIQGQIYHFSAYTGGTPTSAEAASQAGQLAQSGGAQGAGEAGQSGGSSSSGAPSSVDDLIATIRSLLEWEADLTALGNEAAAKQVADDITKLVTDAVTAFLARQAPSDPCGDYLHDFTVLFDIATMGTIDIESPLYQQFYDLGENLLNRCVWRYDLEYNYPFSYMGMNVTITGRVTVSVNVLGLEEKVEAPSGNLRVTGSGSLPATISGTVADCTVSGQTSVNVQVDGELAADDLGAPWLVLDLHETYYPGGLTMLAVCPKNTMNVTDPEMSIVHSVRLLAQDGYVGEFPHMMGGGVKRITVHVISEPPGIP